MADPTYLPGFLGPDATKDCFHMLWSQLDWERRPGAPRREYWVSSLGKPYTYGRGLGERTYYPLSSHPIIDQITRKLEERLGFRYEGCFLNGYETNRDALGWHADNDPGIDHNYPIAVVTVGAGRAIQFVPQDRSGTISEVFLEPGSLLLMPPGFQSTHFHRIPKVGHHVDPRVSLTYRKLIHD